jgi:ligand-binding sensor domain-containing protein/two-component sensor histidine kinase
MSRLFWLAILLVAVTPDVYAERLPIKTYTTADGLAHNEITRIVRDSRGFLWFCTADGLSRFDGYDFKNFGTADGLPHAYVTDFLETRSGEYWAATRGGLVRFDPTGRPGRAVVRFQDAAASPPMFALLEQEVGSGRAGAITVLREGSDGTIWAGTTDGLFRLERANGRHSFRPVDIGLPLESLEGREIADVLEDRFGSLWVSAASGLYRRWRDGAAARYTGPGGMPDALLTSLFIDRQGDLWVGTRHAGFFRARADPSRKPPVFDRHFRQELPALRVFQLFETSDGRFWLGTGAGLTEFFPTRAAPDRQFRSYAASNGISDRSVKALNEDLAGNLWLGTSGGGAMKLTRGGFSTYGASDWIQMVNATFQDQSGQPCFKGMILGDARTTVFDGATFDLLNPEAPTPHVRFGCFDGERFDWFVPAGDTTSGWVLERVTLRARSGEWWIGTGAGLYRFAPVARMADLRTARPLAVYGLKDGLAGDQVFRLFEDSAGNVWVSTVSGTARGLARWDRLTGRVRDLASSPGLAVLHHDWAARAFAEDRHGHVWVGFDGELARYKDGHFTLFTAANGVPTGAIRDIFVDRSGRLWLASARGGLLRVDDTGAAAPTFITYNSSTGLSGDNLEAITEGDDGHIYVGGGRGLDRLDPATGRVKHFTAADGLPPGVLRSAFRDRHGALWFGMSNGLARLVPALEKAPAPPPVFISGLRIAGVPQQVSALGEAGMSLADLTPAQKQLEIDFVGLGFGSGEVLRYQYKLEGADADWAPPTDRRTVTYASLSPGQYTFLVQAVSSDGIVSVQPATVRFRVLRPVWQRWWFMTLVGLAMALIVRAAFRYRLARLLEVAHMRTHIATDLHDDIGANLTRIALLSEVARHTREEESLRSIARIARESVSSMSDIVWAINPKRESLLDLARRMRQHADELFTSRGIALRFDAPAASGTLKLTMDVRRDLLLIFKEAVSNAARHSQCSAVEIELRVDGSELVLVVTDNGAGFDASAESDGQGLVSMRRRAQRIKGTIDITSGHGAGTRVTLSVPV